jgi:hypothetical protein
MKINEFYLISTELRTPYEPRKCKIVKTLRSKIRSDMVLTEVEPPLSSDIYNTSAPINMLILASRHEGKSLLSISEWPIYVYICRLLNN